MQIYGPSNVHGAQSVNSPHTSRAPQAAAAGSSIETTDQVDISESGRIAARLAELPDIRADKVAAARAAIASGAYDDPQRLEVAVDRLLDEIG